ncbi:MAG: hypothetical protein HYV29_07455 [Ignavibacteriales bacterium]|nr:hypothetical protein [Ignavibacteriales bacterium]
MRIKKKLPIANFPLAIVVFASISHFLFAQEQNTPWLNDDWYYSTDDSSFIDPTNFLPTIFKDEAHLKRYLRDDRFYALRKSHDDTLAVDAIFDRAMLIAEDDVKQALLISTLAVMDHRRLGLRIPLLGSIYLPLTAESDSLFRIRRTHLPKKVLDDKQRASDKDKLQHFFGSAYVAYVFNSDGIARWIGDLFEIGEDRFVLGGRTDERDKLANEKGREFGLRLLRDARTLPSDVLWQ